MQSPKSDLVTVITPSRRLWPITPSEFWHWREAFYRLVIRDFQVRFRDTYLGYLWVVVQPLALLLVFSVFIRKDAFEGIGISATTYILSGLVFWFFIVNSFNQACLSLVDNRSLVTQTNLKRALFTLSAIAAKVFDLAIGVVFLIVWVVVDRSIHISMATPLVLLDILGIFVSLIGMGWFFAALCVQFKDVRFTVPFISQLLFFATPVFYVVPDKPIKWVLFLNPFTAFILGIRDHLFGTNLISTQLYLQGWAISILFFVLGGLVFRKCEKNFADMI
ncbi:MAG: ABC transporter permease [Proteobacteria bacterium]|jgi:lipopolysaccharide transport system permease protein|nr:ABC transporter permease [Pseudomonadota bacterium]